MEALKYTIIKSKPQYDSYCRILEELVKKEVDEALDDEIDLLTMLIEKWDEEHNTFEDLDPIAILKYLMVEKKMKSADLAATLNVSKGLVSDILHYKKGLSKDIIRLLAAHFKISQEALNKPYQLTTFSDLHYKKAI